MRRLLSWFASRPVWLTVLIVVLFLFLFFLASVEWLHYSESTAFCTACHTMNPEKTVYVLDGDGALLMNLGGMSTIGHYHPANIVHVCFNNYEYESTGSQAANSKTVDFLKIAKACQYRDAFNIEKVEELREIIGNIQQYQKPLFIQIRIRSGTFKDLPRPAETAELMVKRFMESLT